jgi:hypothetical protein
MYYTIRAFFNGEIEELSDEFFFENKKEYLYTRPDKESLNSFLYTISSEIRRQRYYYTAIRMTFFYYAPQHIICIGEIMGHQLNSFFFSSCYTTE